jgi:hypothetical protein
MAWRSRTVMMMPIKLAAAPTYITWTALVTEVGAAAGGAVSGTWDPPG